MVYCFIPLKQKNIKKRDNYQGIVRAVNADGIHYEVEMSATKTVHKNVHKESMFKPGTERTFEIARGNLFERSDSFRSDILLLPYSISNDSFRSLLLTGCKRSPIGYALHCTVVDMFHCKKFFFLLHFASHHLMSSLCTQFKDSILTSFGSMGWFSRIPATQSGRQCI